MELNRKMIEISKLNESYLKLYGDAGDLMSVSEYFTKRPPNYMYAPSYKSGKWDGTIRLFNRASGLLPFGLYNELFKCCDLKRIDYSLSEDLQNDLEFDDFDEDLFEEVLQYFDKTKIKKEIEARDYQIEGAKLSLRHRRGQLHHATGSGKTFTLYLILMYLLRKNPNEKCMVVVPTIGLVNQFKSDFIEFGVDVDKYIGKFYSKEKDLTKPIVVGTWQSLQKEDEFLKSVSICVTDENHQAKALNIRVLLEKCINTKVRIGMSGSQHENECDVLTVEGSFGPILSVVKASELIDRGFASPVEIVQLQLHYRPEIVRGLKEIRKSEGGKKAYDAEKDVIQASQGRKILVKKLIENRGEKENVLLLFDEIEFGEGVRDYLKESFPNRIVYYVDGGVKADDREKIRLDSNIQEGIIIVASTGTFSVGMNLPKLHCLIFLWIGKSSVRLQQSIGRGLRVHFTKEKLTIYDLADKLHYSTDHAVKRVQFYFSQGFSVKFHEIGKNSQSINS